MVKGARHSSVFAARHNRTSNWPATTPFVFLPLDETGRKAAINYGNMGDSTFFLNNPDTMWRSDGWYTTQEGEGAWPYDAPEDSTLLDKLHFFQNCTGPGVGGEIMLISFRVKARGAGTGFPQTRVFSCNASSAGAYNAWQLHLLGDEGGLRFFRRDSGAETASAALPDIGSDAIKHVTLIMDALNGAIYLWRNGSAVAIPPATETDWLSFMVPFSIPAIWDTNGVTLTVGNTAQNPAVPGERTINGPLKSLFGEPMGDLLIAEITSLDGVLAARRDDIAMALYLSDRGHISKDVVDLIT